MLFALRRNKVLWMTLVFNFQSHFMMLFLMINEHPVKLFILPLRCSLSPKDLKTSAHFLFLKSNLAININAIEFKFFQEKLEEYMSNKRRKFIKSWKISLSRVIIFVEEVNSCGNASKDSQSSSMLIYKESRESVSQALLKQ